MPNLTPVDFSFIIQKNERTFIHFNKSRMDTSKSPKGQQTRELLIEAAFRQFTAHGFHGTSMRKIAEDADLAVGGIYNHFANKDEMLKAVIVRYHPLNLLGAALDQPQGVTAEQLLRDLAYRLYAGMQAKPALLKLFFIELVECQGRHLPEIIQTLLPKLATFAQGLSTHEERLQPLPPLVMMRILLSTLIGYFVTENVLTLSLGSETPIGTLDDYIHVFLHGIVQPEPGSDRGR
jgi:AcrR family transcriptional regulator